MYLQAAEEEEARLAGERATATTQAEVAAAAATAAPSAEPAEDPAVVTASKVSHKPLYNAMLQQKHHTRHLALQVVVVCSAKGTLLLCLVLCNDGPGVTSDGMLLISM